MRLTPPIQWVEASDRIRRKPKNSIQIEGRRGLRGPRLFSAVGIQKSFTNKKTWRKQWLGIRVSGRILLPSGVVSEEGVLTRLSFRVRPGGNIGSLRLVDGLLLDGRGLTNRVGVAGLDRDKLVPLSYGLSQNFPNPFNATTQVFYQIPEDGRIQLVIYNILGQQVRKLINQQVQAGYHQVAWDGHDDQGRVVSSGVYLYRLAVGRFSKVHKMVLLK